MRYGTLDQNGNPVYFTGTIYVDGKPVANPSREMMLARGQKPFIPASPPKAPDGYRYVVSGWRDGGKSIVRTWTLVSTAAPKARRRWSRLSIKGALADARMLPAAKAFLSEFEVKPDYMAWEALTDCDYIEEGYGGPEKWNAILDGAAQALGKTRAEIDAFIDRIPTEPVSGVR